MSLVRNEQTKLTATYLSGISVAIFAVGSFAPAIGRASGGEASAPPGAVLVWAISVICIVVSGTLHYVARRVLRALVP